MLSTTAKETKGALMVRGSLVLVWWWIMIIVVSLGSLSSSSPFFLFDAVANGEPSSPTAMREPTTGQQQPEAAHETTTGQQQCLEEGGGVCESAAAQVVVGGGKVLVDVVNHEITQHEAQFAASVPVPVETKSLSLVVTTRTETAAPQHPVFYILGDKEFGVQPEKSGTADQGGIRFTVGPPQVSVSDGTTTRTTEVLILLAQDLAGTTLDYGVRTVIGDAVSVDLSIIAYY